ncbi:MAG: hypothetical protein IJT01_01780 [Selenomonadaceae bacterium]|nr:hypothetical protein [Selenomonadaceae bacterium]
MRKWLGVATAAFLAVGASMLSAEASMDNPPIVSVFHDGIRFPESVYPYDGGVFISNFGSDTMSPRSDENKGYILYRKDGATKTVVPAGILHKPTAMAVKDGYLFVCDETRLVVYRLDDLMAKPQEISFPPEDKAVNALALDGDALYVSVTNTGRIYSLDVSHPGDMSGIRPQKWLAIEGPNGMAAHNGIMYVATIPADYRTVRKEHVIYFVRDFADPKATKFAGEPGLYDGAALSDDGRTLFVSDWKTASVTAIDLQSGKTTVVYEEQGTGPADIAEADGILYIPDLPNSRLIEIRVGDGTMFRGENDES